MSTEAERIAQYQAGWNDAQRGEKAETENLFYALGWMDGNDGKPQRLTGEQKCA